VRYEVVPSPHHKYRNLTPRVNITANVETPNVPIGNPYSSTQGAASQCSNWSGLCTSASTVVFYVPANLRTPYVTQWIVNVQRQLTEYGPRSGVCRQGGHKMERGRDYNTPIARTGPTDCSTRASRTPWPGIGLIECRCPEANSNYNGLNVKLTQRGSHRLTAMYNYTWSRAIDDGSAMRQSTNDYFGAIQQYDKHPERGFGMQREPPVFWFRDV
jgi:hypothetical protein